MKPVNIFTDPSKAVPLFVDHMCYLCLLFVMLSRLFIAAWWSPAGKGLASWLSFVMFNCVFVTFPCGILGQMWYLLIFATFLTFFKSGLIVRLDHKKNSFNLQKIN